VDAELSAQTANMSIYCSGHYRVLISQNIREQSLARLSASATLDQEGKQPEFNPSQIEPAPFELNFEFMLINPEGAHFQDFR
jgi:hypothetical protein